MSLSRLIGIPLFAFLLAVCAPVQALEIPSGPLMFAPYDGVTAPVPDENAAASRPIAFGSIAKGGDSLSLQIRTGQFERPVDYCWTRAPYTPHELRRESHHFTW
jgi:hypothetical protein